MTDVLTAPPKMTSADVRACIQQHYGMGGEQYAVLFEVRNGTAWRANRSVDAVVMSLWPSLGMELMGMEIKVSRADWLTEYRNPAKASEVFAYFDRWWLVAPEHVAKIEEIPAPWGWLVPEGGKLRQVKDAEKHQNPKAVDRHFLGALLRRTVKTDDAFVISAVETAVKDYRRQVDADIDKRVLSKIGEARADAEQWGEVRKLLATKPDDFIYQPDVIDAIRVVLKSGVAKSWSGLQSIVRALDESRAKFNGIAAELGIEASKPLKKRR